MIWLKTALRMCLSCKAVAYQIIGYWEIINMKRLNFVEIWFWCFTTTVTNGI